MTAVWTYGALKAVQKRSHSFMYIDINKKLQNGQERLCNKRVFPENEVF